MTLKWSFSPQNWTKGHVFNKGLEMDVKATSNTEQSTYQVQEIKLHDFNS